MDNMMEEIASGEVLEQAYEWLCERRKNYSAKQRCLGRAVAMARHQASASRATSRRELSV